VNVIRFAVALQQLATPRHVAFLGLLSKGREHIWRERLPPVLCYKNQMINQRKNAVTLAACVTASGEPMEAENTRIGRRGARRIKALSRKLARQKRGSARRQRTKIRLARAKAVEANRRKDRAHQLSAEIVGKAGVIAFKGLNVRNMTRSAKGTVEEPGTRVRQKAGLSREMLN
jgi:transposase